MGRTIVGCVGPSQEQCNHNGTGEAPAPANQRKRSHRRAARWITTGDNSTLRRGLLLMVFLRYTAAKCHCKI
eukprot:2306030-Amphidinium_carterae.1